MYHPSSVFTSVLQTQLTMFLARKQHNDSLPLSYSLPLVTSRLLLVPLTLVLFMMIVFAFLLQLWLQV